MALPLSVVQRSLRYVFLSLAFAVLVVLSGGTRGVWADSVQEIELLVGESQVYTEPGLDTVAVGDETIADVVVSGADEFLLNGKQAGVTTLVVWTDTGRRTFRVTVLPQTRPSTDDLCRIVGPGFSFDWIGTTLIVSGEVKDGYDKERVEKLLQPLWPNTVSLVTVRTESVDQRFQKAESAFRRLIGSLFPNVELMRTENVLLMRGTVESSSDIQVLKELASNLGLTAVTMITVKSSNWQEVLKLPVKLGLPGVWVQRAGDLLVLRGSVDRPEEKQALAKAAAEYGKVVDLVYIKPDEADTPEAPDLLNSDAAQRERLRPTAADLEHLRRLLPYPGVKVELVRNRLLLHGVVRSQAESEASETIAGLFSDDVVNGLVVDPSAFQEDSPDSGVQSGDPPVPQRVLEDIERTLGRGALKISVIGTSVLVEGAVSSEAERNRIRRILDALGYPFIEAVTVQPQKTDNSLQVRAYLSDLGVAVKELSDGVVVATGSVTESQHALVTRLMNHLYPRWVDGLVVDRKAEKERLHFLRRHLPPSVTAEVIDGKLFLSGHCREEDRDMVEAAAKALWPELVSTVRVDRDMEPIQVHVRILEVEDSGLHELGVDLFGTQSSVSTQLRQLQTGSGSVSAAVPITLGNFELSAKLRAMASQGKVRTLAAPNLVFTSGSGASFLAGGEIPLPVKSDGQTSVQWRDYGVKLTVSGVIQGERLRVELEPEVSLLDWTNKITIDGVDIPAVRTRRARTSVYVKSGQSIILGGLLGEEQRRIVEKVPLLGDLPVLGALFTSKQYQTRKSDLVVILTPLIGGQNPQGQKTNVGDIPDRTDPMVGVQDKMPARMFAAGENMPAKRAAAQDNITVKSTAD